MKKLVLLLSLISMLSYSASAQSDKETVFALDQEFKGCEYSKATYIYVRNKQHDSLYEWFLYHIAGTLIRSEETKDEDGELVNGITSFYNSKGKLDSTHSYKNGVPDGDFYYWNDTGAISKIVNYQNGVFQKERYNREKALKTPLPNNVEIEGIEVDSEFPGGLTKWKRFLEKNLEYPDRAINLKKAGTVKVMFIVDKEGNIKDIRIYQSVEYSLDKTALAVIRQSKKWTPAFQNGRYVKTYKIQPITFALSR